MDFEALDTNHDGALSRSELGAAIGAADPGAAADAIAAQIIELGDADGDGELDVQEFEHVRNFTEMLLQQHLLPAAIEAALGSGGGGGAAAGEPLPPAPAPTADAGASGVEAEPYPATPAKALPPSSNSAQQQQDSPAVSPLQEPGDSGGPGVGKSTPAQAVAGAQPPQAGVAGSSPVHTAARHASADHLQPPATLHTRAGAMPLPPRASPSSPAAGPGGRRPEPLLGTDQIGGADKTTGSLHAIDVDQTTLQKLRREVVQLPPVNMGPVVAANLKELRQVRRGLRKARRTMEQVPMAMLKDQQDGEATGTAIVHQLKHQSVLRMQQADKLLVAAAGSSWRQVMAIEQVEAEGSLVPPELLAAAKVQLAAKLMEEAADEQVRLLDFGQLAPEQKMGRFVEAGADLSTATFSRGISAGGAQRPSSDDLSPWQLGEFVDALVTDEHAGHHEQVEGPAVSFRAKVMGASTEQGRAALCVLMLAGPDEGRLVDWPRDRLRPLPHPEVGESARLDQIKGAYSGLLEAYDRVKASVPAELRRDFEQELGRLREECVAVDAYGRYAGDAGAVDSLPQELSRFLRMRVGILRRGRRHRAGERRFPDCDRCGANSCEGGRRDPSNGGWYCGGCWHDWETEQIAPSRASPSSSSVLALERPIDGVRHRAGSWIRSAASADWATAGATVASQRRQIEQLTHAVGKMQQRNAEMERAHVEREEIFEAESRELATADFVEQLRQTDASRNFQHGVAVGLAAQPPSFDDKTPPPPGMRWVPQQFEPIGPTHSLSPPRQRGAAASQPLPVASNRSRPGQLAPSSALGKQPKTTAAAAAIEQQPPSSLSTALMRGGIHQSINSSFVHRQAVVKL
eukprot:SAG22_NODE_81_length_21778_cov_38.345173_14_plen_858_part_00